MKTLEDVQIEWSKDCEIDSTDLIAESQKIPRLHSKYSTAFHNEVLRVKKIQHDLKTLERDLTEYYNGTLSSEDLKSYGWEPFQRKVLRQDLDKYLQSDKNYTKLSLRLALYEQKAKFLEDIVRQISNRNFIIKNMIDWAKFQNGGF